MDVFNYIIDHASYAHWIVLTALLISGLNIPIFSEDLLIIASALVASTIVPENTWKLILFILIGTYVSDNFVYWTGRLLGGSLLKYRWFQKLIPPKKIEKMQAFYDRRGILTLIIGRFIPFGVRNAMFFTAGMGKMHTAKFMIGDAIACSISNCTLFFLTFFLGKNFDSISQTLKKANLLIFIAFALIIICVIWYSKKRKKKAIMLDNDKTEQD